MALKCKSCGGRVTYDIETKKLICEFCDSSFALNQYHMKNDAEVSSEETDDGQMEIFTCKSCGATLSAPKEQIVSYCSYCGSESMEFTKIATKDRIAGIVPFTLSKDEVRKKYKAELERKVFLPKEFLDEEFLSEFRGIYIPYWQTKVDVSSEQFSLKGTKSYTAGGYDYHEEYAIDAIVNGTVAGGYYDASMEFDDTVAAQIAPFTAKPVNFHEGYLAGFYADTVTSNMENYQEIAKDRAYDYISDRISKKVQNVKIQTQDIRKHVQAVNEPESKVNLYPVWFLTWRKKNRLAYSVMNGQTGKLSVDLPIDYFKLFRSVGIQAVIYFIILSLIPFFFLPLRLAGVLSVLLYLSGKILDMELKQIRQAEQHVFDYGDEAHKFWKKIRPKAKNSEVKIVLWVIGAILIGCCLTSSMNMETPDDVKILLFLFAFVQLILTIKSIMNLCGVQNKLGFFPVLFGMGAQIAGFLLAGTKHPEDYWYYIISLILVVGMLFNMLTAIFYINELTTRPVPNFFKREGANHA